MSERGRPSPSPRPNRAALAEARAKILDCILREGGRLHARDYKQLLGDLIIELEERLQAAPVER